MVFAVICRKIKSILDIQHFPLYTLSVGRGRVAQLAIIRQISGQVSRGSAGEYQADERAGVAGLS